MGRFDGENITGKIFALVLAVILWVYVMNEQNPPVEQTVSLQLEVRGVSPGLLVTDNPEGVKIRFRAPRSIIAEMKAQDLAAYVDVRGLAAGDHSVPVKTVTPVSLVILEVLPKVVTIRLESQISRQLSVTPKFTGAPAVGAVINRATIKPNVVTVTGPKSIVDVVDTVSALINVDGLNRDALIEGTPQAYMKNGMVLDEISLAPDKVQAEIIMQGTAIKKVDIKPVIVGDPAEGAVITRILTEPEKVEIRGQDETLKMTDWLQTVPIDVTGQTKDVVREVKLEPRPGIIAPDNIKVIIRIEALNKSRSQ